MESDVRVEVTMPIQNGASKSTREKNIKTEIAAGRPVKQAVAIAYAEQRKVRKGKKS